jgi:phage/plasmid-like protein (TIGR03299 family)
MRKTIKASEYKKVDISSASNIAEALEMAKGNWNVYPTSMITSNGIDIPDNKAIVREDSSKVLGIVGNRYELINNSEAFAFFDTVVQHNKAKFTTYQEFDGGKKTVLRATFGEQKAVRLNDPVRMEIRLVNSFDGSTGFSVAFECFRLVCMNGMIRKTKENVISIRHTKNKEIMMRNAFTIAGMAANSYDKYIQCSQAMAQKAADATMIDKFLNEIFEVDVGSEVEAKEVSTRKLNQIAEVRHLIYNGRGNNGSSVWDIYNGVTEYVDHDGNSEDSLAKSSTFGSGYDMKDQAFKMAMALV